MCSELAPRAHIPDTRIPQLMQPCHPPGPADVITGFSGARMWLLVLLLQALVWCDYTFNTSTDHMSVASRYTISGQIDPATLPDDYKRGWNGWLQGVKLLITEGRWSIVGLDWRVYDLISKEVWSEIIAHSQGYQSNFRMTTSKLYILMTTRKWGRYQNYFRWLLQCYDIILWRHEVKILPTW